MILSDDTRRDAIERLKAAASHLEAGAEKEAGVALLHGLKPVAVDLRRVYGPMVKLLVGSWVRSIFEDHT